MEAAENELQQSVSLIAGASNVRGNEFHHPTPVLR
jgi:hypothetical protein